jgi:hypothetical protein
MGFWGHQSGWGSQIHFQVFKGILCFLSPSEHVLFLEGLKERESPEAESRDEPAQGSHEPRQIVDVMEAIGHLHFHDSRHLLWVRVNSTTGDHIPD